MKIDNNTLENMEKDIKVILKYFDIDPKNIDANQLNNFWFHTYMNRNYPDNNPNVKKDNTGKRILPYIEDYELYPCETNDTTIYTAWNKLINKWKNESYK